MLAPFVVYFFSKIALKFVCFPFRVCALVLAYFILIAIPLHTKGLFLGGRKREGKENGKGGSEYKERKKLFVSRVKISSYAGVSVSNQKSFDLMLC